MGISWSRTLPVMAHRGKFGYMDRPAQHIKSNYCSSWSCLEIWKDSFGVDLNSFQPLFNSYTVQADDILMPKRFGNYRGLPKRLCSAKSKAALEFYSKTRLFAQFWFSVWQQYWTISKVRKLLQNDDVLFSRFTSDCGSAQALFNHHHQGLHCHHHFHHRLYLH